MPIKDKGCTVCVFAEDVANGGGKTGDAANITLRRISDGTDGAIAGAVTEVSAANHPGVYKITLTDGENNGEMMYVGGKSSSTDIVVQGVQWTNEVNVGAIQEGEQSASDLKDFADEGYDPATNKVQGVVLVDTTTTNSDMVGTNGALLAASAPANWSSLAITGAGAVTVGTNNDKTGYSISGAITTLDGLPTAADMADQVWDELYAGHVAAGSFGILIQEIAGYIDTEITALQGDVTDIKAVTDLIPDAGAMTSIATSAALTTVDTVVDAIKVKTDQLTFTGGNVHSTPQVAVAGYLADFFTVDSGETSASSVAGSVVKEIVDNAGGSGLTAAGIADAVWDETLADHLASGSTGNALNAAGSAGDPWATALPGAYGAGTAGNIIGNRLDANISSRLAPSVVGRNLDVSAAGNAGIDWGNVENPTTAVVLSGTTIGTVTAVSDKTGYSISGTITTLDALDTHLDTIHGVGSWEPATGFSTHSAADAADAVWDELTAAHTAGGSFGALIQAIAGYIDTEITALQLDVTGIKTVTDLLPDAGALSSIAQGADLTTVDGVVDAIKVKTDQLTFTGSEVHTIPQSAPASFLADFFIVNSGETYASSIAGSVVKELADNAGGSSLTVDAIANGVWDEALAGHLTAGSTGAALDAAGSGSNVGAGADTVTLTFTKGGLPIADADVWVTSDSGGTNVVAGTVQSNSMGQVTFLLDHGNTYYAWLQKDGCEPIQGDEFVANRD